MVEFGGLQGLELRSINSLNLLELFMRSKMCVRFLYALRVQTSTVHVAEDRPWELTFHVQVKQME